jgi:riboflavin kinase / FMN adenylyltransferase
VNLPVEIDGLALVALPARPLHLAIGMFDGVHLGHRAVIEPAVLSARRDGGTAAVLTFWPHPSALFRPENPTRLIQDRETKARVLSRLGIDTIITERFTPEFASITAGEFLPRLKQLMPMLAGIYVGENFRFGHKRRGDAALLLESGRKLGLQVLSAPRVNLNGEPISSTRIRAQLESGDIEAANALLGYAYFSAGVIVPGKQLGRTIGFPTLNVPWAPQLRPKLGVYVTRISAEAVATPARPAVANYGLRPTVENATEPRLEVHVLGECPFNAGDRITVEWLRFVRAEAKFANVEDLRAQIGRDRLAAEAFFRV